MARVTALREERRGRVAVELDGEPWRILPTDVVVRAGLSAGVEVDRERARTIARELRRARALAAAGRALRHRDLTTRALDARLEWAGIAEPERRDAVGKLVQAGLVDDERFAEARARLLAERGYGDEAIRWDLERQGVDAGEAARTVAALAPERERAAAIVARRGAGPATTRLLVRRGFGEEAVEVALDAGE